MRTALLLAATAVGSFLPSAPSASAVVLADARIEIRTFATYHDVCGFGEATADLGEVGYWVLTVQGSRDGGHAINQSQTFTGTKTQPDWCTRVMKFGAAMGEYQASLSFTGVSSEPVGLALSYGAWQPGIAGLDENVVVPAQAPELGPR